MSPRLERCRSCGLATPTDTRVCTACGQPWRTSRGRRLYAEIVNTTWAPLFVLALAIVGGAA